MRIVLLLLVLAGCDKLLGIDHVTASGSGSQDAPVALDASTLDNDLVAHISFDTNVSDSVAANLSTCASACPALEPGKLGNAAHFAGGNGQCVTDKLAATGTVLTVAFWFQAVNQSTYPLVVKPSGTGFTFKLDVDSPRVVRFTGGVGNVSFQTPDSSFIVGNWVHVVLTLDSSGVPTLYINGMFAANHAALALQADSSLLSIGCAPGAVPVFFAGFIDDVRIYSRVLTTAEIGALPNL